jgi:hypothetical protein
MRGTSFAASRARVAPALVAAALLAAILGGCAAPDIALSDAVRTLRALAVTRLPAPPPSAEAVQLADAAGMTAAARTIFFAAQPVVDSDRGAFEAHCRAPLAGNAVELGCYTPDNRIYVLKIDNPKLSGEMAVVAAHEMLHAAYALYTTAERNTLTAQLEAAAARMRDPGLAQTLRLYAASEPDERENELHSILGSEYGALDPALEAHYWQYFGDRAALVSAARQFNQTFADLQATLASLRAQIDQIKQQMALERRRNNIRAYNALVPQYNALIKQYNQTVVQYNALSRSLAGEEAPAE